MYARNGWPQRRHGHAPRLQHRYHRGSQREGIAAYCASKGGALMLARQMALDYARQGVRVNVVCPGWIDTPFNDPAIEAAGGKDALLPFVDRMVPIGRQGTPEEVADVVAFLASDDARLMTGSVLTVDGGLTAQ